jgi:hypothetical protein
LLASSGHLLISESLPMLSVEITFAFADQLCSWRGPQPRVLAFRSCR